MTATATSTRNVYLVSYPRDFSNEYDVYAGPAGRIDRLEELLRERIERRGAGSVERITRRRAIQLGITRVNEAKKYDEQWFGGFAGSDDWDSSVEATIAATVRATEHRIMELTRGEE